MAFTVSTSREVLANDLFEITAGMNNTIHDDRVISYAIENDSYGSTNSL
jgi:hypothetical protein